LFCLISFILLTVYSLTYVIVEYSIFNGGTDYRTRNPADACFSGLQSSKLDLMDTHKFDEWFDDSSILELAETGVYKGAAEIREYAEFFKSPFYDYHERLTPYKFTPVSFTKDECIINVSTANRAQINAKYGRPRCAESVVSFTAYFTVEPEFHIRRINLFYSQAYLTEMFAQSLNTDSIRDFVCNVMESNCQSTFQLNNATSQSCRETYDALPSTNTEGHLDDNSKGCRILHSAFAAENKDHCPHLSFVPENDLKGRMKCQESKHTKPSDLFTDFELDSIRNFAIQKGFLPDTLFSQCDYGPSDFIGVKQESEYKLGVTNKIPLSGLSDHEFLFYITFTLWVTMLLTGLGSEVFVWMIFLEGKWDQDKEDKWKIAQFLFPLLGATTVGLAISHNYLAVPMLVVTMWKFGFPETILYLHAAMYDRDRKCLGRIIDLLNGIGMVVHHSSSALYVGAVVTNLIPSSRVVLRVTMPLLMQHWFVLLRYSNKFAYTAIEILLEVWFEWTAITSLELLHQAHWTGGVILGSMLFAHWMYLICGTMRLFVANVEVNPSEIPDEAPPLDRLKRKSIEHADPNLMLETLKLSETFDLLDRSDIQCSEDI